MTPDLEAHISTLLGEPIRFVASVSGGDINQAFRIETPSQVVFLKRHEDPPPHFFAAEADGLKRLGATGLLRVPGVLAVGHLDRTAYLLLEWIEPGPATSSGWKRLGVQLAALHRTPSPTFGLERDNFIGALPQLNSPSDDWPAFFRDRRIGAQLDLARRTGALPRDVLARGERFQARLNELLAHQPEPALLHGDLWAGNVMADTQGQPVVVDPAVYWGDREVELAFTTLFGGFDRSFYNAYAAAWPLPHGHAERRDIYNLYPLLVHANLFGGGYVGRVDAGMRRYVA